MLICFCNALQIWRYGHDTALMHSKQIVDNPSYVNYVEFNKAETHLLVHCVCREDEFFNTVAILSIEKGKLQRLIVFLFSFF